jgi:hypothetical protein
MRFEQDLLLAIALLAATPLTLMAAQASPPTPKSNNGNNSDDAIKRATTKLQDVLRDEATRTGNVILTGLEPGVFDTAIVRVALKGAYPGSGVARVVLWNNASYGIHGEHDLGDLVRALGWLKQPPDTDSLVRIVNAAQFEGVMAVDSAPPPSVTTSPDGLVLTMMRISFPSGARDPVKVVIGAQGPAVVTFGNVTNSTASASSGMSLADASHALDKGSAVEKSQAITSLGKSTDPAAKALLAKATTLPNEQLATDALQAIGNSPEAAAALRKAWADLSADKRAELIRNAGELHGSAFAAQLGK